MAALRQLNDVGDDFVAACHTNDIAVVRQILRSEATSKQRLDALFRAQHRDTGLNVLQIASKAGFNDLVQVLLDHGAPINWTPKSLAVVNSKNKSHNHHLMTPLQLALLNFKPDTAAMLIEKGADPSLAAAGTAVPLDCVAYYFTAGCGKEALKLIKMLVQAGAVVDSNSQLQDLMHGMTGYFDGHFEGSYSNNAKSQGDQLAEDNEKTAQYVAFATILIAVSSKWPEWHKQADERRLFPIHRAVFQGSISLQAQCRRAILMTVSLHHGSYTKRITVFDECLAKKLPQQLINYLKFEV